MANKSVETKKPPLMMLYSHLDQLPEMSVPEPYVIRSEVPGDDKAWEKIITESFQEVFSYDMMTEDKAYRPERVLFVTDGEGVPVATAASWVTSDYPADCAVLHMVGALAEHSGHRLGFYVCLAAMVHAGKEGFSRMVLRTDDFRIPAIKTYLRLGFVPCIVHENHIGRWQEILRKINREDLAALLPPAYDGTTTHDI